MDSSLHTDQETLKTVSGALEGSDESKRASAGKVMAIVF